jgi:acetolactate synthase-like protein
LSGLPGIAIVTAGPGLTNTITAVKNAQLAESPVVIMAGATAMILKGRGSLQDIDQQSLMRPHVKQQWTIKRVRDIVPIVRAALHVAASGVPGPVFIEYPIEVLWPQDMMAAMVGTGDNKSKSAAKSESITDSWTPRHIQVKMMARMQEWYLKRHFDNVFANAFDKQPPAAASFSLHAQTQTSLTYAPSAQLAACAMAMCNSKRPLILLGSQSTVHTLAAPSLRKAIEALGFDSYLQELFDLPSF